MSDNYLNHLTDVGALSTKNCSRPIQVKLAYATPENFIGRPIKGYTPGVTDIALMTRDAAASLCEVQNELTQQHLGLLIYDSYRPRRAVLDFVEWSKLPVANDFELTRKAIHYPHIAKADMFELGYVSANSQHCYGHTVDLVLIDEKGNELNHGACFDFMDKLSHLDVTAQQIGEEALHNRNLLASTMRKFGFLTYPYEFWHFNFNNKMINDPMDIAITADLKGLNVI
ncbi:MAG: M15 family metallopeptidase [Pseudomonadota bacterium]